MRAVLAVALLLRLSQALLPVSIDLHVDDRIDAIGTDFVATTAQLSPEQYVRQLVPVETATNQKAEIRVDQIASEVLIPTQSEIAPNLIPVQPIAPTQLLQNMLELEEKSEKRRHRRHRHKHAIRSNSTANDGVVTTTGTTPPAPTTAQQSEPAPQAHTEVVPVSPQVPVSKAEALPPVTTDQASPPSETSLMSGSPSGNSLPVGSQSQPQGEVDPQLTNAPQDNTVPLTTEEQSQPLTKTLQEVHEVTVSNPVQLDTLQASPQIPSTSKGQGHISEHPIVESTPDMEVLEPKAVTDTDLAPVPAQALADTQAPATILPDPKQLPASFEPTPEQLEAPSAIKVVNPEPVLREETNQTTEPISAAAKPEAVVAVLPTPPNPIATEQQGPAVTPATVAVSESATTTVTGPVASDSQTVVKASPETAPTQEPIAKVVQPVPEAPQQPQPVKVIDLKPKVLAPNRWILGLETPVNSKLDELVKPAHVPNNNELHFISPNEVTKPVEPNTLEARALMLIQNELKHQQPLPIAQQRPVAFHQLWSNSPAQQMYRGWAPQYPGFNPPFVQQSYYFPRYPYPMAQPQFRPLQSVGVARGTTGLRPSLTVTASPQFPVQNLLDLGHESGTTATTDGCVSDCVHSLVVGLGNECDKCATATNLHCWSNCVPEAHASDVNECAGRCFHSYHTATRL